MPFSAKLPNGKLINLANEELQSKFLNRRIFQDFHGSEFYCLSCGEKLSVVKRINTRMFFKHSKNSECSIAHDDKYKDGNHIEAEIALSTFLTELYKAQKASYVIATEYPFPEIGRRADVVVLNESNEPIAVHEIQLSVISNDEIINRTDDYECLGLICCWHFGMKAAEDKQLSNWFIARYGYLSRPFLFQYEERSIERLL